MMPVSSGAITRPPRVIATSKTRRTPPKNGFPMALSPFHTSVANITYPASPPKKCATVRDRKKVNSGVRVR